MTEGDDSIFAGYIYSIYIHIQISYLFDLIISPDPSVYLHTICFNIIYAQGAKGSISENTLTRQGGATRDGWGTGGARTHSCHDYDRAMPGLRMMSAIWRSFSAAASYTPSFSAPDLSILEKSLLKLFPSTAGFLLPSDYFCQTIFSFYCCHSSSRLCKTKPQALC